MSFGRSELVFPNQAHARLAHTWLKLQDKSQVEAAVLMALKIPKDEEACVKLLELLAETEREIEQLKSKIEEGEAEVDELVEKLYGLAKSDRKVIRDFLERF